MRQEQTYPNETTSPSAEVDGSGIPLQMKTLLIHTVQVFISQNRACTLLRCDFYGDSIWNMQGMKMGRLFPWILPPRGWFQEVSHLRNPFHVVVIFDKCEVVDGSDYTAQRET